MPDVARSHRCPICGDDDHATLRGPSGRWHYEQCHSCEHAWVVPTPTADELTAFYNTAYQVPPEAYEASAPRVYEYFARHLPKAVNGDKRLLEVGASSGALLRQFAEHGWRVEGVEIDARAAARAVSKGTPVLAGTLRERAADLHGPYDAIVLSHVIEHDPDPLDTLALCARLLVSGGHVVLRTPNVASISARHGKGWWQWAGAPAHLHLFSPESLGRALTRVGLTPTVTMSHRGDADGILPELLRTTLVRRTRREADASGVGSAPRARRFAGAREVLNAVSLPLDALVQLVSPGGSAELMVGAVRK